MAVDRAILVQSGQCITSSGRGGIPYQIRLDRETPVPSRCGLCVTFRGGNLPDRVAATIKNSEMTRKFRRHVLGIDKATAIRSIVATSFQFTVN
jgi:hypothetical protein